MSIASSSRPQHSATPPLLWPITWLLLLTGAVFIALGLSNLIWGDPFDLHSRWIEEQYILRHQDPYDVMVRHNAIAQGLPPPATATQAVEDPRIGVSGLPDYPPWAYFSGIVFFAAPWPIERVYFALLNLLALGFVAWFSFSLEAHRAGRAAAWFLVGCVLAADSVRDTLYWGQYGILIVAFLAGAIVLIEKKMPVCAGLLLGVAMLKPSMSGPFLLCFVITKHFRTTIVAIAYLIGASLLVWAISRISPIPLLREMMLVGGQCSIDRASLLKAIYKLGLPISTAVPLVAITCGSLGAGLMWLNRRASLLTLYAIASVIARIWTYHHQCDNVMIVFLLVCLARRQFETPTALNLVAVAVVGLSLWVPLGNDFRWPVSLVQHLAWCFGLVVLLINTSKPPQAELVIPEGLPVAMGGGEKL